MIHNLLKIAGSVGEVVELIGVLVIVIGFVIALFSVVFFEKSDVNLFHRFIADLLCC